MTLLSVLVGQTGEKYYVKDSTCSMYSVIIRLKTGGLNS